MDDESLPEPGRLVFARRHPWRGLRALVEDLRTPCVAVVGDIMLDEYIYGDCYRISPEAPVPVLKVVKRETALGGAGNVAMNVLALGGRCGVVAAVGEDESKACVRRKLVDVGIADDGIVAASDRPTTRKTRLVAGIHQIARYDEESTVALDVRTLYALASRASMCVASADVVVISDYGKGVVSRELANHVITTARARGIPVIVDPKGREFDRYRGATLLVPNAHEARAAVDGDCSDWTTIGRQLLHKADAEAVAIKCGADGIVLVTQGGGQAHRCPTLAQRVFDVIGAGDTVVAALAVAVASGVALIDAVDIANAAAGVAITKQGTSTVTREEIITGFAALCARKRLLPSAAADLVVAARAAGQRVVFTNGCFDLLHDGHLHLLERARALGDVLIVGLNTDASVARLKGPQRPVQLLEERARVLTELPIVDAVVEFAEDTPAELLRRLRPDVLVKGGDYTPAQVAGREHAAEVVIVPRIPSFSTTSRIAEQAASEKAEPS